MISLFVAYKSFDGARTSLHRARIYGAYTDNGRLYGIRQDGTPFSVYISNVIACDAAGKAKGKRRRWCAVAAVKTEGGVMYL